MKQRGKGITAKLLVLVMLAVFLCGSTVMAQEAESNDWLYVCNIKEGDIIRGISAGGSEGKYIDYSFYVNGKEYRCEDGNVHLNRFFSVTGINIDNTDKTVKISGDQMIKFWIGENFSWKKIGDMVTLDLAQEYKAELDKEKDKEFIKWYVWGWRSGNNDGGYETKYSLEEAASMLGVEPEKLQEKECTVTFTLSGQWEDHMEAGIDPSFEGSDSTISGNVPSEPEENKNTESKRSGNSGQTAAQEPVSKKEVVLSDGTTLTSKGAMHNIASGINGAAVMTSQEEMNARAGLSAQDVEAGVNAKMYMGNTYKKAEKIMLADAVSQIGAKVAALINIDLYTIGKTGEVAVVDKLNGEEPVRVVIGLPAGVAKEGRSFSLVYMDENGQAVEIPDLDNDLRTLTVDLTRFGAFAIVYR